MPTPARAAALDVLLRVGRERTTLADALATPVLDALDARDRSFTHELVLGTLRRRGWLDHALARLLARPLATTPPPVLDALRLGAYQILFLRVPAHAAVSETVDLVRAVAPSACGFANAVLRRLLREGAPAEPDPAVDPVGWLETMGSLPRWLAERWNARLGSAVAVARARAALSPPPIHVRLNPHLAAAQARVTEHGLSLHPAEVPGALEVSEGRTVDLADEGVLYVQDQHSQLVAHLAACPGLVLDACAAPGGKALLMADLMGPAGRVVAADASCRRLARLGALARRWKGPPVCLAAADAARPPFAAARFDAVLLDAPCSGLGTLARHPDIRWRVGPADLLRHAERQRRLIDAVAPLVRPGGRLVYATCSTEPEENEEVVLPFLERGAFEVEELPPWTRDFAAGPFVTTQPEVHRGDAFFAARLRRRS